jgi:ribonuclease inhibitor
MEIAMECEIDGSLIVTEGDFHREISRAIGFGEYYGKNLDALWDTLSADVERPVMLTWKNANVSRSSLGDTFDKIVSILARVKAQDERWGLVDKFDFVLR